MIFEYAPNGELFDYIVAHGRLSEKDARKFMRQIVSALEYCHSLLIIHRDLKPENLLLDEGYNIKISDFGLSNIMEPGKRFTTFCGSLHYACPEILRGEEYVGPGVDIWSMGVILYCLVVGRQPWDAENAQGLIKSILEDGLEVPSGLSEACVDLLLQLLRVSEYDRIPIAKIRTHPWIMEDYDEPPPSYLPLSEPIKEIDECILEDLYTLNFIVSNDTESLDAIKEELLSNERTQLVVVYNLLLIQKNQKLEKSEQLQSSPPSKTMNKIELEQSNPSKENPASGNSITSRKKKKSIIITTARGESSPEAPKKKSVSKKPVFQTPGVPPSSNPVSTRRNRSASMSPDNNNRPIIDLENIIQNKIATPKHKKRSQTPQKSRRPVLSEAVFKPPEESNSPELKHVEQEVNMTLLSENKSLSQIVDEVVRVLTSQGINYRKRKNKYLWKCSVQTNNEIVTLQLEIIKANSTNYGIILRRIQGSFQGYQVLYNEIKKDLNLL